MLLGPRVLPSPQLHTFFYSQLDSLTAPLRKISLSRAVKWAAPFSADMGIPGQYTEHGDTLAHFAINPWALLVAWSLPYS